ncbi:M48 family metallopeptidase [Opitutus sp. GAS368]|jgi:predicted Zn-dependent protease|uniref:M48 family metallopeptidase n=1 Tax=Opitutus sp. GAS368 TaxID=1882749 RepID=UPI00087C2231|nr:M48 family metallopeptidase [Opitutus sp. GAS368]SDS57041.1 Peptidase family M48 [Opitutus sp. GAS368]
MKSRLGLGLLTGVLLLAGCYTVPETGRSSFIMPFVDDVAQGTAAFTDLKAREKISDDPAANERVARIGRRIAAAVGDALPGAKWEFVVFDAPKTVNAFALPGGKVGVYSGLLALTDSDDEIAIVMGHEIGHVTARHGAERMSKGVAAALLGVALDVGLKENRNHDLLLVAYGVGAGGAMLKFSRDNESEADFIGIRYAAKAGYDPRAAVSFWQKMEKQGSSGAVPAFLSTHPTHERRVADLQGWMPQVLPLYEAAKLKYGN